MKILSIDVGIKNLAYCVLDIQDNKFVINYWNIIDLSQETENKCNLCNKKGLFFNNQNIYYCNSHAKKNKNKIPTSTDNINIIKKLKINDLKEKFKEYKISDLVPLKKDDLINLINEHIENNYFKKISKSNANEINIIELGINLKKKLDKILFQFKDIEHIIIENQIGPIANRMKTLQGMISQYFIMNNLLNIYFISASNKLNQFICTKNTTYSERKKLSIEICKKLINDYNKNFLEFFLKHKKKDDLADCFLQGIHYLIKNKKLII